MAAAAELFQHHAFVDLETTGLDPASDRVIEVGVLFIHEGRPLQRISRLFRAAAPLPLPIRRLTGIDDGALAGRPLFEEFVPQLRAALSGWTVVAHNASFERGFLAELLEEIDAPVLDSCELLHYLYPELDSYSLESMIRWTGIGDRAAHRALKDCEDTFAMLCRALDRCIEERRAEDVAEVLQCLAPDDPEQSSEPLAAPQEPIVGLLARLAALCPCSNALPRAPLAHGTVAHAPESASRRGPWDLSAGEASVAPQTEMAEWLERALAREGVSAVEPSPMGAQARATAEASAAFAKRSGCRVSLVVGSDSRLSRLLESELPSLQRGSEEPLRYSFLDEQRHYLCRRRAMSVCRTERAMSHEERAPRAYLRAFLRRSPTGDIGRLSHWFKLRYPLLQRLAFAGRSEPATTLAGRCPHYGECFYHSALSRSREAELLLLRHSSVAEWPPDFPPSRHLVIDEAHRLEGAFSSALSRELSDVALARLSDRLLGVGGRGGLLRALEAEVIDRAGPDATALQLRDGAKRCQLIWLDGERLGTALASLFPAEETVHRQELLLTAALRAGSEWAPIRAMLFKLKAHLAELGAWFSELRQALPSLAQTRPDLERDVFGAVSEVLLLIQCTAEFAAPEGERCLFASIDGSSKGWKLRSEPLHVSQAFGRLAAQRSVVLSSPALSVGERNPWVLERLGVGSALHRMPAETSGGRPLVLLIDDSPRPFEDEFLDWAASRIGGIATFLGGRVMGVFSSQARLSQMEDRLRPALERVGIEAVRIFRARRDGRDAVFTAGRVLLGARSIWHQSEPLRGLACAFIDKLPIEPLSRPSVAAREALASVQGEHTRYLSMPYRLPKALVLLRDWLSTCVVTPEQKMVVVLAYPGAPPHRDAVVEALDGYQPEVVPWSAARLRIYEALRPIAEHGPETRPLPSAANT